MDLAPAAPAASRDGAPATSPHAASVRPLRRLRIAVVGPSPCLRCHAACCRQNGHAYAALLETEDERRRFRPWSLRACFRDRKGTVAWSEVLPYVDGRCPFLDEHDRCRVYEVRPQACRRFECTAAFALDGPGRHGEFLRRNPAVLDLLASW